MSMVFVRHISLMVTFCVAVATASAAAEPRLGRKIDDFELQDYQGQPFRLADHRDAPAVVVAFLGVECPLAKAYAPRLAKIRSEFADRGVVVVAIDANEQDALSELGQFARANGIDFPLLKDPAQKVTDQFGAERTPEVFLLDADRVVRYHGRVDDQFGVGYQRPEVTRRDLAIALSELLAGHPITQAETPTPGCLIGRLREPRPDAQVTWSNQIVRIMQTHCQECHRPNEIGPFSLLKYAEAVGWAGMIAEVVAEGRMPPWHANPAHGKFKGEARLSDEEKQLIQQWLSDGAPAGDPADLPPPREFTDGWYIGEPDLVLYNCEEPEYIPATGVVDYRYFVVDPQFREAKWLQAMETRPSNRSVVHHVAVYALWPGQSWTDAFKQCITGYTPGASHHVLPTNVALYVPAGVRFVFQMHYTVVGTPQTDRTALAFKFADPKLVERRTLNLRVDRTGFTIPPNDPAFELVATYRLEHDGILHSMLPHMHLRGKSFRIEATYPDGEREVLLDVPHYDFNWQHVYRPIESLPIPSGTEFRCIATYDNSTENLANPDPSLPVDYGFQLWEEMMDAYLFVSVPVDPELLAAPPPLVSAPNRSARSLAHAAPNAFPRWPWFSLAGIGLAAIITTVLDRRRASVSPTSPVPPSSTTAANAHLARLSGWWRFFAKAGLSLLALAAISIAAWSLFDTHRALLTGWQPTSEQSATKLIVSAWTLLLLTVALTAIPPLRRVAIRFSDVVFLLAFVMAVGLAFARWRHEPTTAAEPFHLRQPSNTMARRFLASTFAGPPHTGNAAHNSQGVRGSEIPANRDVQRVLCLGGSTTECLYLDDGQAWPALLEQQLNSHVGSSYWVGNAGKTNCSSAEHLKFLETSSLPAEMDLIVCLVGMDDLWQSLLQESSPSTTTPEWTKFSAVASLFGEPAAISDEQATTERESEYWDRRRDPSFPSPRETPDFDRALAQFQDRLRSIIDWGRQHDVRIVFVTQPAMWDPENSWAARKRLSLAQVVPVGKEWTFLTAENLRPLLDRFNDALRAVCGETNTEYVDLADTMSGREYFFLDDVHFNPEGCERAGRQLAEHLARPTKLTGSTSP